ncbi:hypothetical protein ABVT39_023412 [Epinephelus coioides]
MRRGLAANVTSTVVNSDMAESQTISDAIAAVLPDLPDQAVKSVEDTLEALGAVTADDLKYTTEGDLLPLLKPIQARRLIAALAQNACVRLPLIKARWYSANFVRALYGKHLERQIELAEVKIQVEKRKLQEMELDLEIKRRTLVKLDLEIQKLESEETVRRLHNSEGNNRRYEPEQGLSSPHNEAVTSHLVAALTASPDMDGVDRGVLLSACKTYYETVRRNFRYSKPDLADQAAAIKNSARSRQRRKREPQALRPTVCGRLQERLEMNPKYVATHHKRLHIGSPSDRLAPTQYDPDAAKRHLMRPEA